MLLAKIMVDPPNGRVNFKQYMKMNIFLSYGILVKVDSAC